jgi:hypothetical protein
MNANYRSIHHYVFKIGILRERFENTLKGAALHPASKPLENRIPLAKLRWKIPPRRAGSDNPQNASQK